jgi:hypothetical protein
MLPGGQQNNDGRELDHHRTAECCHEDSRIMMAENGTTG